MTERHLSPPDEIATHGDAQAGLGFVGWIEALNISTLVYCESGGGKSNAYRLLVQQIKEYEKAIGQTLSCTGVTTESLCAFLADNGGRAMWLLDEAKV